MKLNIKTKLIFFVLFAAVVFFILIYVLVFPQMKNYAFERNQETASEISQKYSLLIQTKLDNTIELLNTILKTNKENISENEYALKNFINQFPSVKSIWSISEISENEYNYKNFSRINNEIIYTSDLKNNEHYVQLYKNIKNNPKEADFVLNKKLSEKDIDKIYYSLYIPSYSFNEPNGITGIDIDLKLLIEELNIYIENDKMPVFLATNQNLYEINSELINKQLPKEELFNTIKSSPENKFYYNNSDDNYYIISTPVLINFNSSALKIIVAVDTEIINEKIRNFLLRYVFIALLSLFALGLILFFIFGNFMNRLKITKIVLNAMADGNVSKINELDTTQTDELSSINKSVNLINSNLDRTAQFIEQIASGNFNFEYLSLIKEDNIGNLLIGMRENLKKSRELEIQRKEADERQTWATLGAAKFSEIIREHSDNLEELAYAIIRDIVNYIDATQGGLFIINENEKNEKLIELIAAYAYNRKKMLSKKITWGVGLVGRCILEKETIFITKVPEKYLSITSGLGEKNPASLLIVPLIFHEEVFGVVELASFKEIEQYKIDLVEQVSESIASAIQMVKINVRTAELLRETKIKSEQSASQEEEIRQNIEEMQAATDELNTQLDDVSRIYNALFSVAEVAVFDANGRIIDISEGYLKFLNKNRNEIIGKIQGSFSYNVPDSESFNVFWRELRNGKTMELEQILKIDDESKRTYTVYIPVKNQDNKVYKVIGYMKQK
jgi:GAF domain-containing protein